MSRNRSTTMCDCGLCLRYRPEVGRRSDKDLFGAAEYVLKIGKANWSSPIGGYPRVATLFAKVICPLCFTEYVGWFSPPSFPDLDGPEWELYDTSYWSTYNDEPGEADIRNWRDPKEVLYGKKSEEK